MEYNQHQAPMDRSPHGKTKPHHRVAARLKAVVKNIGSKPNKK